MLETPAFFSQKLIFTNRSGQKFDLNAPRHPGGYRAFHARHKDTPTQEAQPGKLRLHWKRNGLPLASRQIPPGRRRKKCVRTPPRPGGGCKKVCKILQDLNIWFGSVWKFGMYVANTCKYSPCRQARLKNVFFQSSLIDWASLTNAGLWS